MSYYFSKVLNVAFDDAVSKVTTGLQEEGFGVLSEIDVQATLKKKLNADMPRYKILGACHPTSAYQALQVEDKIGTMLPCNVIVQERADSVEVSAVDPVASMQAIANPALKDVAEQVRAKLKSTIEHLTSS
ncbi:MAG: DUF302 domain-containing protein [Acaryochloridaceae cyanobacterium RU_4_10]|jgi:uncharacterized protein (DUF302 family)|nr:DUF302 domain-containing protein [Acaryochloridaceae cyanobacterium RU_4_10]